MKRNLASLYLTRRAFAAGWCIVVLFVAGHFVPLLEGVATAALLGVALVWLGEMLVLYGTREGLTAERLTADRWSNGDENPVSIRLESRYHLPVRVRVIDELPVRFQRRDLVFHAAMAPGGATRIAYAVRPRERGAYAYGHVNVFVRLGAGLVERRYALAGGREVAVFPSFLHLRRYELMAISDRLLLAGAKKVRRVAQHVEFEHIQDYAPGDDPRTLNWKATARRGRLMVNHYQDEKAQQVYAVIDAGRTMELPFDGLSLLDHALNSALVLSDVALLKEDRAGLLVFSNKVHQVVQAARQHGQLRRILGALYALRTDHAESDMEVLYATVRRHIPQRSLLVLYTNFESVNGLSRQLPALRRLATVHRVVVVFFLNTELEQDLRARPTDTAGVYVRTITERYMHEKRQVVLELERHGIGAILTRPEDLSVNVINTYIALKARGPL